MEKFKIKEVVTVSVATYKAKWRTLILISLLSSVISVSVDATGIVAKTMAFSPIKDGVFVAFIVLTIVSIYFTSRLSVALIIASKTSDDLGASAAYGRAKPVTWRYIGFAILFGLMLIIPMVLVIIGMQFGGLFSILWSIRGLLVVIGSIYSIYIITVFRFSVFAAVLYPHESRVFAYSKNLVKGNFMKVFFIMLIPLIVTLPILAISLIFKVNQASALIQIGASLLEAIPTVLIAPFSTLLALETMKRLEDEVMPKVLSESESESEHKSQVDDY
ncbi:hypothetical protein [Fusibacter ferrireducens]|uniref:Glycerophosphoryl diester phosphodiesterase membrane domain-containing protein n=1 Tax=Fusibacter ferrireducens TaxID=2785058 RepID=A0ABR9ZTE6_9FIRM|nr:hypothetical protein [Fusibacter ferrireducens]MBF4693759.1 hypothetical protein [Fusibacter ferrireducens]